MESTEFESSLISDLNQVLLQAAEAVESEERLDLTYEVLETVRFEQAQISWLDRLRNTAGSVELRLAHAHLSRIAGEVRHLADPFMILDNSTAQFLVNYEYVVAAVGLSDLSQNHSTPDAINWLDNVWFHNLVEHRVTSTWYLMGDYIIEGLCRRTGFDSLDIETNSKIVTIPKQAIVANRTIMAY